MDINVDINSWKKSYAGLKNKKNKQIQLLANYMCIVRRGLRKETESFIALGKNKKKKTAYIIAGCIIAKTDGNKDVSPKCRVHSQDPGIISIIVIGFTELERS